MTVFITLTTAGLDSGPFNLYSDLDGFVTPFEVGVAKLDLEAGYSTGLAPDFTSVVRVLSTSQYCINYVDIILTEPTTTTTSSTVCQRPEGLTNKAFNWKYIPPVGPEFIFTGSFLDACTASDAFDGPFPSGSMEGKSAQLASLTVGETVYLGIFSTDCTLLEDGFYITDLLTNEITEVVGGIIISISNCPTTTTTTTVP
jgi:hypothetical protein